jgi:hypothetical protein
MLEAFILLVLYGCAYIKVTPNGTPCIQSWLELVGCCACARQLRLY